MWQPIRVSGPGRRYDFKSGWVGRGSNERKIIDKIYINGTFVTPHGSEIFGLINPSVNRVRS